MDDLQKSAEIYNNLLANNDFLQFQNDLDLFIEACKNKILGDFNNNSSGCKTFEDYRYWLGRLHSAIEIKNVPKIITTKALLALRKEQK